MTKIAYLIYTPLRGNNRDTFTAEISNGTDASMSVTFTECVFDPKVAAEQKEYVVWKGPHSNIKNTEWDQSPRHRYPAINMAHHKL